MREMLNGVVAEVMRDGQFLQDHLGEICSRRAVIHFRLGPDTAHPYVSRFQDLHGNGDLMVDPPFPADGISLLKEAGSVEISYVLGEYRYQFETHMEEQIIEGGPGIRLSRPGLVRRITRRRYHRIRFAEDSRLPASLSGLSRTPMNGWVYELGEGGAGGVFVAEREFMIGAEVKRMTILLPDGSTVHSPATVRNVSRLDDGTSESAGYRCGLEFTGLKQRHRATLAAFVFRMQQAHAHQGRGAGI